MKTIRRSYDYQVAIISLEVVVWGVIGLLRSIIRGSDIVNGSEALAQALALIFVGVPIFLFHWLWSQNASAKDPEEKTASLRAIFLYGTLLGTLIPAVRSEEHTSELQSQSNLVCRLLLEKTKSCTR